MTHNQHNFPLPCHYSFSEEYFNSLFTENSTDSQNFPIYLEIEASYCRVQLENKSLLTVSCTEYSTKAQPLEAI